MDILLQIENIIENNGSDFELSKLFKQYIKEYKDSLDQLFEKNQGKDFLVRHTKKLDSIIELMYKTVLRRTFGNYLPMKSSIPIAVVALGSYGREQLCVHSDIDLLIVYEDVHGYNTELIIEKLFYLALDAGLKLGHRVHEVQDLFKASNEDITIRTSLMESRFICGSSFTWHATTRELQKMRLYQQKEFILNKIEEAQARRKRFSISMEPNIKEGVGGLRDSQLIYWVAKTIYGVESIKELSGELFTEEEYREYRIAIELLFRVRSALHLITGKQEDTLRLEHIPQVTKLLGFSNQKKLSTKVLEAGWRVNNFTQIFVKKMVRSFIYDKHNITEFRKCRIQKGIYKREDRIFASYNLKPRPINELLELLINLEDQDYKFDAGFLNQFTYTTISHPLRQKTYTLIKKLLKKEHIYSFLKLFYDAGILHELFPNFKKVLHLPQFDGYHHYPVDLHSVKCIEALENIKEPFIKGLYDAMDEKEKFLLKIVVFLHDSGKGRKQDHSEVGAKLVAQFAKKMQLDGEDTSRAITLVKHHILMSSVAFKDNIHNEKTLYKFMSNVGDEKNLKLLYVLTYADINGVDGVGGKTYTAFSAKLLYELYTSALEVAQNKERITDAKKRISIEKKVKNLEEFKTLPRVLQNKILSVVSNLFFFKNTPQNIIKIAQQAQETKEYTYNIKNENSLTIEIFRRIPLNVGYLLSTLSHLDVASMEIFTLFDNVKYFKIDFKYNVDPTIIEDIKTMVEDAFDMSKEVKLRDIEIKKSDITIDFDHSLTDAEINIQTKNQIGLLAYVMHKFEQLNINIVSAKIHSSKFKVRDSFLMEKQNNICNNADEIYKFLTK
ncbi:HD domain-containing protein [Sulfurimonas marina]|uniref:Bifunctional uridylyltransferase/uridylyl-removing enzyme n=1 Tax=Sulfurimonas marina TaxID=2590551 RepID=A0A7M1AW98_9BACT|nr:HD domain-containing protein [Sulfurimonas marina]QOP40868.1 HD domain-containing protein [Sulfurimonas marina]